MKSFFRLFLGVLMLAGILYVLYRLETWKEPSASGISQPPVIEITPEILLAINRKVDIVKVEVPLNRIDVPFSDRTALWGYHSIEHGVFWSSGRLFVAFESGQVDSDGKRIEVTLGKPVFWGLDDTFTTEVHNDSMFWSADPHFVDNARKMGRQMLISGACKDGSYEKSSVTASAIITDFIKDVAPDASVVVHTTPASC